MAAYVAPKLACTFQYQWCLHILLSSHCWTICPYSFSQSPCLWITEPFKDAHFIANHDTITTYKLTHLPMVCPKCLGFFFSIPQLCFLLPTFLEHVAGRMSVYLQKAIKFMSLSIKCPVVYYYVFIYILHSVRTILQLELCKNTSRIAIVSTFIYR